MERSGDENAQNAGTVPTSDNNIVYLLLLMPLAVILGYGVKQRKGKKVIIGRNRKPLAYLCNRPIDWNFSCRLIASYINYRESGG